MLLPKLSSLRCALSFLTICPWPEREFKDESFQDSTLAFPWVGLILGILGAIIATASAGLEPHLQALLLSFYLCVISGGLHLDGIGDSCDALFSYRSKEQMMEILKDPRLGTMGFLGLFFHLCLKLSLLYSLCSSPEFLWSSVLLACFWSRFWLRFGMMLQPYARPEGMGKTFWNRSPKALLLPLLLFGLLHLSFHGLTHSFWILTLSSLPPYLWHCWSGSKLSGATGDTLGAGAEIAENTHFLAVVWVCT